VPIDVRLHRERDRLVSERVQHVNRIKGLCALQGIYDYNPLRPQAMAGPEQLRTTQGGALPPRLKSEIKRELQRLELVVDMIATLEAERNAIVEDEASTHVNAKKIQNLHELKAIGPEFAAVLVGEIFHRDFNNRRQLASMSASRRARSRAEMWHMTKGSARLATARDEPPGSNSPGCGCAINPTAI
jgi:transposase